MRLIDADALRDALGITGAKETCKGCQYNKRFNFACNTDDAPSFAYVCEAIDDAPTVDAVPVIRCKDCKYYRDGDCWHEREDDRWIYYRSVINEPNPDDYCSLAERKE